MLSSDTNHPFLSMPTRKKPYLSPIETMTMVQPQFTQLKFSCFDSDDRIGWIYHVKQFFKFN